MLLSLIAAQIDGMMRGMEGDELAAFLVRAAEEAEVEVLGILEEKAGEFVRGISGGSGIGLGGGGDGNGNGGALYLDEMGVSGGGGNSGSTPVDLMDGWDFMVSLSRIGIQTFIVDSLCADILLATV